MPKEKWGKLGPPKSEKRKKWMAHIRKAAGHKTRKKVVHHKKK
jgi:hypothetical protein